MTITKTSPDTLPEELLVTILDHLDAPSNLQALYNLSLTNHLLHRLTIPLLYHRFPGHKSELFLRTVSHYPELGCRVKEAVWHQERKTVPRIDIIEKTHIVRRLNQLAVPQQGTDLAEQFAKFGKHDDYWYMEVLLLFMPQLEELEIRDSWLWDDHHYWFKSLSPFFNPLCDSRLKKATLHGPLRIENMVPLLTIPTLRTLELTQVVVMRREGYRVFQWSIWPVDRLLAEKASNLETLTLKESYIDLEFLVPIIRGIKALQSFTYEHIPNDLADDAAQVGRPDSINADSLASCLALQRSSLGYLRIRDTSPFNAVTTATLFAALTSPDSQLERLHTLDMGPFEPLCPQPSDIENAICAVANSLPSSLTILRLKIDTDLLRAESLVTRWNEILDLFLVGFVRRMPSLRPSLKTLELVDWDPLVGWLPDQFPYLQKLYRQSGLRLGAVCGDAIKIHGAEPLVMEEVENGEWVMVTDLRGSSVGWYQSDRLEGTEYIVIDS
jgi:hypothetical protein